MGGLIQTNTVLFKTKVLIYSTLNVCQCSVVLIQNKYNKPKSNTFGNV